MSGGFISLSFLLIENSPRMKNNKLFVIKRTLSYSSASKSDFALKSQFPKRFLFAFKSGGCLVIRNREVIREYFPRGPVISIKCGGEAEAEGEY